MQDVPAYHVAAGNPARILRKIERKFKAEQDAKNAAGPEQAMAELATKLEKAESSST